MVVSDHRRQRDIVQAHVEQIGLFREQSGVQQRYGYDAQRTDGQQLAALEIGDPPEQDDGRDHDQTRQTVDIVIGVARRDLQMMDIAVVIGGKQEQRQRNDHAVKECGTRNRLRSLLQGRLRTVMVQQQEAHNRKREHQQHCQRRLDLPLQLQAVLKGNGNGVTAADTCSCVFISRRLRQPQINGAADKPEQQDARSCDNEIRQRARRHEQHGHHARQQQEQREPRQDVVASACL